MTLAMRTLACLVCLTLAAPASAGDKGDLVTALAAASGLSKADAKRALDGFVSNTAGELAKGSSAATFGFGTFDTKTRAERKGLNPATGEAIQVGGKLSPDAVAGPFVSAVEALDGGLVGVEVVLPPGTTNAAILEFQIPEKVVMEKEGDFYGRLVIDPPAGAVSTTEVLFMDIRLPAAVFDNTAPTGDAAVIFAAMAAAHPVAWQSYLETGDDAALADAVGAAPEALASVILKDSDNADTAVAPLERRAAALAELAAKISKDADLSLDAATMVVEILTTPGTLENALKKKDSVSLVGFGSFSISKRSARTGRNPQTGKEIKIAAKTVVRFKAGAELSKSVNIAPPGGGLGGDVSGAARYALLDELLAGLKGDFLKFYDKGNKAAGTRVRKGMQDLKSLAQDIRVEVQTMKNDK